MVGVAVNVAVAPEHIGLVPVVCAIVTEGVTVELIVMVIPELVTVAGLAQAAVEVIAQVTTWLLASEDEVKVCVVVPVATPFTIQLYAGVPPFTGVAVKVSEVPEQAGLVPVVSAIETEGVTVEFTVMVILLLVAVEGLAQLAFEVMTQETTSLFPKVVLV